MFQPKKNRISYFLYVLCVSIMCYTSLFFYPRWKQPANEATISWDVSGYYWYLPSIFIYKDLKHQSFKDNILDNYGPTYNQFQQGYMIPNGNYVMKYSCGMSIMYLPFFAIAHLVAGPLGYPKDGFSTPYQVAIQLGGLLISLIGLWYFRRLMLYFYLDSVVAIVLFLLVFGSNYLNYSAIECGMAHCWLFTLYVFLILNTLNFYKSYQRKYAVRIGLLIGLLTLIRPTEIISCIIPLLWGMENLGYGSIKNKINILFTKYKYVLLSMAFAAAIISIQLIYWRNISGHWYVYSYRDQHLYFRSPNFIQYTFSYRTGWLIYTPTLLFAFIGIIPFILYGKNKVAIIAFFLLNYYVVCSWNIWWYGGRAMIQSYPVLFFCIAELISVALNRKVILWLLMPVALLFVYFNIWMTNAYHKVNFWDSDCMSGAYFWHVAGRWSVAPEIGLLKDNPEMYFGQPKQEMLVYQNNFASETGDCYISDSLSAGKSLRLDKYHQYSPTYKFPFQPNGAKWIRAQATFSCKAKELAGWRMAQFVVRLTSNGKTIKENMERVFHDLEAGQTKNIQLDMKLPDTPCDSVSIWFWNADSDIPIKIADLKAWTFK